MMSKNLIANQNEGFEKKKKIEAGI